MLADSGEDALAFCPNSDYAANVELAEAVAPATQRAAATQDHAKGDHTRSENHRGGRGIPGIPLQRNVLKLHRSD